MSDKPSSLTVNIWNHSGVTLTRYLGQASKGGAPTAEGLSAPNGDSWQTVSVPDGTALQVKATNSSGDCAGDFAFEDANRTVKFTISYDVPNGSGDASVAFHVDNDYPSSIGVGDLYPETIDGPNVTIDFGFYVGCAVTKWNSSGNAATAGYAVPVFSDPYYQNNARDAVNSMFGDGIRVSGVVSHWYDQSTAIPYKPADYSGGQLVGTSSPLMQAMLNLWPTIGPGTSGPDYPIIDFLANFLVPADTTQAPLVMYVPKLAYKSTDTSGDTQGPVYELHGYQAYPLAGSGTRFNTSSVQTFLQLLLAGAHFVNIQADSDFQNFSNDKNAANTGRDLYNTFKNSFTDNGDDDATTGRHSCTGNSHYAGSLTVNTSGWYYGGQRGEWASDGCGLLLALLFAKTADSQYNTFMQLEGWPADTDWWNTGGSVKGGDRHAADYNAYKASLWNISTFGAAPYSEKRATTIFLAPAPWVPSIYTGTYMMPYVGAETPQSWLKTSLVKLPSGTPSAPEPYKAS